MTKVHAETMLTRVQRSMDRAPFVYALCLWSRDLGGPEYCSCRREEVSVSWPDRHADAFIIRCSIREHVVRPSPSLHHGIPNSYAASRCPGHPAQSNTCREDAPRTAAQLLAQPFSHRAHIG